MAGTCGGAFITIYFNYMVKPPDESHGETEDRILDAANDVFMRHGTGGARMQEIAEQAGVNKALLHYYFRSKERLAEAVFKRAAQHLMPAILKMMVSDAPLEDKVRAVINQYMDVLTRTPYLPGYLLSEMHHHPDRLERLIKSVIGLGPTQLAQPIIQKLRAQIAERVEAGTMRPIAPEQFMINLIALCVFPFAARPLLTAAIGGKTAYQRMLAERRETLADFFLAGLRP